MSLDIAIIAVGVVLVAAISSYLLATFGGAISQNVILPLALFAGTGSLLATGTIEMAGRYGFSTLLALFAFTMVFIFSIFLAFELFKVWEHIIITPTFIS